MGGRHAECRGFDLQPADSEIGLRMTTPWKCMCGILNSHSLRRFISANEKEIDCQTVQLMLGFGNENIISFIFFVKNSFHRQNVIFLGSPQKQSRVLRESCSKNSSNTTKLFYQ